MSCTVVKHMATATKTQSVCNSQVFSYLYLSVIKA